MTTGIQCQADPHCQIPAPADTGICHCHTKQAAKTDRAIGAAGLLWQARKALSRQPEKELE
jgi:hypothetical protein